jgi:hypothetical protein
MRVVVMVRATAETESETSPAPSAEMLDEMTKFNEELVKAGVMLGGDGLQPSSKGARVHFSGTERTVVDGPFTEAKELIAGYWVWQVKSMDEAIEWARRIPNPTGQEGAVEIRPVYEAEDFGEAYTPEVREREERIRAQLEQR